MGSIDGRNGDGRGMDTCACTYGTQVCAATRTPAARAGAATWPAAPVLPRVCAAPGGAIMPRIEDARGRAARGMRACECHAVDVCPLLSRVERGARERAVQGHRHGLQRIGLREGGCEQHQSFQCPGPGGYWVFHRDHTAPTERTRVHLANFVTALCHGEDSEPRTSPVRATRECRARQCGRRSPACCACRRPRGYCGPPRACCPQVPCSLAGRGPWLYAARRCRALRHPAPQGGARLHDMAYPCTRRPGRRRWAGVSPTLRLRGGVRVHRERKLESESERDCADEESSVGTSSASSATVCSPPCAHGRHACTCTRGRKRALAHPRLVRAKMRLRPRPHTHTRRRANWHCHREKGPVRVPQVSS